MSCEFIQFTDFRPAIMSIGKETMPIPAKIVIKHHPINDSNASIYTNHDV